MGHDTEIKVLTVLAWQCRGLLKSCFWIDIRCANFTFFKRFIITGKYNFPEQECLKLSVALLTPLIDC